MSTRALVTGGSGFVAQWAIRAMLRQGWMVTAADRGGAPERSALTADERNAVRWLPMDITRQADVAAAVDAAEAEIILHLAAVSHVPDAASNPGYAFEVNAVGTVRLLSEVRRARDAGAADPFVLVVGSAEQYGRHDEAAMPLVEGAELRPLTLYAASKVAQEAAALQAARADGLRVVCTRSFSHSGAGQAANFLLPALVERALRLPPAGGTLVIGNGDTVRDFLHVEDVVDAYLSLFTNGVPGEVYNVASADGISVRTLAQRVLLRVGRTADISSDAALLRPVDVPVQVGDNRKLCRATGWAPRRTRDDIIDDLIHAATH